MGYAFTCDGCGDGGDTPGMMASFNRDAWLDTPFGSIMQERGWELGDTITLCRECTANNLEPRRK